MSSGYVSAATANRFTPSTPFRFTDTRDAIRLELNAGQSGMRLAQGQTLTVQMAGMRGIPAERQGDLGQHHRSRRNRRRVLHGIPVRRATCRTASNVNYEFGCTDRQRGRAAAVGIGCDLRLLVGVRPGDHRRQRLVELRRQTRYGSTASGSTS